jgi:hypothetical protein
MAPTDPGTSSGMTAPEPLVNQPGEMYIQEQRSLLPGFYFNSGRDQTGKKQLKAIQTAKPLADVKTIRSFVGLCNFFRTHIKDFAVLAAPIFKLTRKDSGYKGGPLPQPAAFINLRKQLISELVMAFPRTDRQYTLIMDTAVGTADTSGGLGAILTQVDQDGKFYAISFASRQLKNHEKTIPHFNSKPLLQFGEW